MTHQGGISSHSPLLTFEWVTAGAEQAEMLEQLHGFDRRMIHERYERLLEGLGARLLRRPSTTCTR